MIYDLCAVLTEKGFRNKSYLLVLSSRFCLTPSSTEELLLTRKSLGATLGQEGCFTERGGREREREREKTIGASANVHASLGQSLVYNKCSMNVNYHPSMKLLPLYYNNIV